MKQRPKRRLFNWFIKSWWLSSIITVLPPLILAYISIWKPITLSTVAAIIFSLIICGTGVFTILRYWADSIDVEKRENADRYYQSLTERNLGTIDFFTEEIISYITANRNRMVCPQPIQPFSNKRSALSPIRRIDSYVSNACQVLAQFFDTYEADIGVGIYVKNDAQKWVPLKQMHVAQRDQSFTKTLGNQMSSFYQVVSDPNKVFFMEKKKAYDEGKYVPTANELQNGICGSIYCSNISLVNCHDIVLREIILCITTYEALICQDTDSFAKKKAEKLFQKIGSEIKYEIANLALYQYLGLSEE